MSNINPESNQVTHDNLPTAVGRVFNEVCLIRTELEELKKSFEPKLPTELLTRDEVKNIFKCDLSTIHNWCKKGKLKPHGIGNRVYFKRSEIEAALLPIGINEGRAK